MSLTPINMPALSDTMETGRLVEWKKQTGDAVKKGDVLAEVESDKAIMDVEAFDDGYLTGPLAAVDADVPVGSAIGYLSDKVPDKHSTEQTVSQAKREPTEHKAPEKKAPKQKAQEEPRKEDAEDVSADSPPTSDRMPPASQATGQADTSHPSDHPLATPYAKSLARELGVDLAEVASSADAPIRSSQVVATAVAGRQPDLAAGPAYELTPLTSMQRAIAEGMAATTATPTFRVSASLSTGALRKLAREHDHSFTVLLARACARVVQTQPRINAAYTRKGLALRQQVDVGIAVAVPAGLITPVLKNVAERPLEALSQDWKALKQKVESRRLALADYSGATFYLSNLGTFKTVTRFDAVLPLGASAILALGAEHRGRTEFTLTCDHRVLYGADAAEFFETLNEILAQSEALL